MRRLLSLAGALVCAAVLAGCNSQSTEIKPETQGGQRVDQATLNKGMEESLKHMPPEMQEKMKANMEMMKKMQEGGPKTSSGAPGGAPSGAPGGSQ